MILKIFRLLFHSSTVLLVSFLGMQLQTDIRTTIASMDCQYFCCHKLSLADGVYNIFSHSKKFMLKIRPLVLITAIFTLLEASFYPVSLSNPVELNSTSGLQTIGKDLDGNFLVGFEDGEVRKYSTTFSTYINLSFPEPVELFSARRAKLWRNLTNGTIEYFYSKVLTTLSNNFTTLRSYNYSTYE